MSEYPLYNYGKRTTFGWLVVTIDGFRWNSKKQKELPPISDEAAKEIYKALKRLPK